ncbi:MAG: hypothetical protein AMJ94_01360 [Deltaproteobacteria bacterium SM23_61]|nr:MAG: hypothetical protein AMJ94_01360 [Deltaproteobacteria bacterium SM23_61]
MRCPKCNFVQSDQNTECLKCGIVFEKYQDRRLPPLRKGAVSEKKGSTSEEGTLFEKLILFVEPKVNPFYFGGRIIVFLIIFIWGWKFILTPMARNYAGESFFHLVNLPFHEAGHLFFQLFGQWMGSLGGTLGQLLIPSVCLLVFLIKMKNPFGASVSLWWLGESFMDIAPYINDARTQELVLLGGITGREADYGYHDWEFILNEIGLLQYDHTLAHIAQYFGIVLMFISFAWAGYLLYKQYKNLDLT